MGTVTMEEAACAMDGCNSGAEGSAELFEIMMASGLVAFFMVPRVDDDMVARGALTLNRITIGPNRVPFNEDGPIDEIKYFCKRANKVINVPKPKFFVTSVWVPERPKNTEWLMKVSGARPRAKFKILNKHGIYCIGIVFQLRWPA